MAGRRVEDVEYVGCGRGDVSLPLNPCRVSATLKAKEGAGWRKKSRLCSVRIAMRSSGKGVSKAEDTAISMSRLMMHGEHGHLASPRTKRGMDRFDA
jgi:hypothetical protein